MSEYALKRSQIFLKVKLIKLFCGGYCTFVLIYGQYRGMLHLHCGNEL